MAHFFLKKILTWRLSVSHQLHDGGFSIGVSHGDADGRDLPASNRGPSHRWPRWRLRSSITTSRIVLASSTDGRNLRRKVIFENGFVKMTLSRFVLSACRFPDWREYNLWKLSEYKNLTFDSLLLPFSCSLQVWPDLAKKLLVFGNFFLVYYLVKVWTGLANLLYYLANFDGCKWPNNENKLTTWSHSSLLSFNSTGLFAPFLFWCKNQWMSNAFKQFHLYIHLST